MRKRLAKQCPMHPNDSTNTARHVDNKMGIGAKEMYSSIIVSNDSYMAKNILSKDRGKLNNIIEQEFICLSHFINT